MRNKFCTKYNLKNEIITRVQDMGYVGTIILRPTSNFINSIKICCNYVYSLCKFILIVHIECIILLQNINNEILYFNLY